MRNKKTYTEAQYRALALRVNDLERIVAAQADHIQFLESYHFELAKQKAEEDKRKLETFARMIEGRTNEL